MEAYNPEAYKDMKKNKLNELTVNTGRKTFRKAA